MQQLHLVGLTTENDSLICSARKGAKTGSFTLPLDERLLQVIAEAVVKRNAEGGVAIEVPDALQPSAPAVPRRQSHLSPREIQDRLRAGRSLEIIAAEAGVGEEWVGRFAAPVEAERLQVVNRARGLIFDWPRHGESGEPLGMSVRWNLADKGVRMTDDEFDAAWSGYLLAGQAWMVTFTFESRKRTHEAEWEVDLGTGELLSRNRLGTELGFVEPGRRRRSAATLQPMPSTSRRARAASPSPSPESDATGEDGAVAAPPLPPKRRRPARKAAAKRPATRKAAGTSAGATSSPTKRPAVRKAAATASAAKRSTVRKATSSPAKRPARKAAAPSSAAKRSPARKAATPASAAKRKATSSPKRPAARKAASPAAKRAATRKATKKKATTRRTTRARGVPPAATTATAAAEPNELGRRRLQLATGTAPPARKTTTTRAAVAPASQGVRIAAVRSGDVARPAAPPAAPKPDVVRPEPGLDVPDEEAMAEARRNERRRARAERQEREAAERAAAAAAGNRDADDDRVVTIRANRTTPPTVTGPSTGTGASTGANEPDVIVPADSPPLRPAQPATQPRKRRFGRTTTR